MAMKARKKFLIIAGVMFAVGILATIFESNTDTIDIPFVPDLTINGLELPRIHGGEKIQTGNEILAELRELFPNATVPSSIIEDYSYQSIEYHDFKKLIEFTFRFYHDAPAIKYIDNTSRYMHPEYISESFDCDNFSKGLPFFADLAGAFLFEGQIPSFRISVKQVHSWGGVPAGGYHSINVVKTTKGWQVVEPQGDTYVDADKYPNRLYVRAVKN